MRRVTGWLWRFGVFRACVVWIASGHGPGWLIVFVARETPFMWSLRELHLARGEYVEAIACAEILREWGEL